jgi:hypothetical protein
MPDLPDDYPFLPGSVRFPLVDLGELAARLGSPNVYDRRGESIFQDVFEKGLGPWKTSAVGTGGEVTIVGDNTDLGAYALRLTGGSTGGGNTYVEHTFSLLSLGKVGGEFSFLVSSIFDNLLLTIDRYDGSVRTFGRVRLTYVGGVLAYLDTNGVYQNIASPGIAVTTSNIYHNIKLVIDVDDNEYMRLLFDSVEYDLSDIPLRQGASLAQPSFVVSFELVPRSGENDSVQLGRCIVTGNEP